MLFLKIYFFPLLTTLLIWAAVATWSGAGALLTVIILTLLEITFSAENAVINSRVLATLRPLWQEIFMTLGIVIAVFLVRFLLPLAIVMFSSHLSLGHVIDLAIHDPGKYSDYLQNAEPSINAFGGSFLLLVSLSYFIDLQKKTYWLKGLEKRLGRLGRFDNFTIFCMLAASIVLYLTAKSGDQSATLLAAIIAVALYTGLGILSELFIKYADNSNNHIKYGWAAFTAFLYLEVLDASFSFDGVIGAFALTKDIFLIMAGLGAGAVWVRALTVHLVRSHTLNKFRYLEHGAHWAIAFLGIIMWLKLYGIVLPQIFVGTFGLIVIGLAVVTSRRRPASG